MASYHWTVVATHSGLVRAPDGTTTHWITGEGETPEKALAHLVAQRKCLALALKSEDFHLEDDPNRA